MKEPCSMEEYLALPNAAKEKLAMLNHARSELDDLPSDTPPSVPLQLVVLLPPVLDACCGPKGMWFDKHNPLAVFMDRRKETHVDTYPCGTKTNVIDPCVVADFTAMPFPDESFRLVVFDPPHIEQAGESQITKKYGALQGDWREMLRAGFAECFRVLKPEGVLIFKWNDCSFPVKEILPLAVVPPLFGHKSGKKMGTHWIAFLKQNSRGQGTGHLVAGTLDPVVGRTNDLSETK